MIQESYHIAYIQKSWNKNVKEMSMIIFIATLVKSVPTDRYLKIYRIRHGYRVPQLRALAALIKDSI